eukprot:2407228-Rhodomonas_salina.1
MGGEGLGGESGGFPQQNDVRAERTCDACFGRRWKEEQDDESSSERRCSLSIGTEVCCTEFKTAF